MENRLFEWLMVITFDLFQKKSEADVLRYNFLEQLHVLVTTNQLYDTALVREKKEERIKKTSSAAGELLPGSCQRTCQPITQ